MADGDDPRALTAASWLARKTSVRPIVISREGRSEKIASIHSLALEGVEVQSLSSLSSDFELLSALKIGPDGSPRSVEELRAMLADPLYVAAAHVLTGRSEACVAGASRPTADVIRAGLRVIGLNPGTSTVSSSFLILLPDGRRLGYGDCAVIPRPNEHQLAQVAIATAHTYRDLIGLEPVVAMLSFSTMGSSNHPEVKLVNAAMAIVREEEPRLCIDGELQFDAAMVDSVGRAKAPDSSVAGHANVLIFPNLAAGNIGYKITERLAGAVAIGPILQGLRRTVNDLSRGCTSATIVSMGLLTAVRSLNLYPPEGSS